MAQHQTPPHASPRVSVVIPCFNGQDFVTEAIRSALGQSVADIEVIVVDDASTDGSRQIVEAEAARDPRVVPLFLEQNAGPAAARNGGFSAAKGTWIALLDADDLYRPDRLELLLELAETHDADVVADNLTILDADGSSAPAPAFDYLEPGQIVHVDRRFFFAHIWESGGNYPMGLLKPMFRRAFLDRHRIVYDTRYRLGEDFLLYLNCVLDGAAFYLTGDEHYVYRRRPDSLSQASSAGFLSLTSMCDEILHDRRAVLDHVAVKALISRRQNCRNLAATLQLRELRDLRRSRRYGAVANYIARNPAAALNFVKTSLLWRLRQWRAS